MGPSESPQTSPGWLVCLKADEVAVQILNLSLIRTRISWYGGRGDGKTMHSGEVLLRGSMLLICRRASRGGTFTGGKRESLIIPLHTYLCN